MIGPMEQSMGSSTISGSAKVDECAANWTEVWCFDKKGDDGYFHIRELYLMTLNLSGTLAPKLGFLSHLEAMDFMWNNLTGKIPKEIGNIASLKLFMLSAGDLEEAVEKDAKSAVQDGIVHHLTNYVINYVKFLYE
ncbi:putative LRR receptor serine/threonine-protein kinase [Trifolium repens]|nr:putative LRR receptor serine/threonine-protein kinase [Trifolium repens]